MNLDLKGLEAVATMVAETTGCMIDREDAAALIRAYLSAITPAEVGGLTPLEWSKAWGPDEDGDESHTASTPFGSYTVERSEGRWVWRYCFDEYYDEDRFECESLEDGRQAAQANWNDRVSSIVAPAKAALTSECAAHAETRRALDEAEAQRDEALKDVVWLLDAFQDEREAFLGRELRDGDLPPEWHRAARRVREGGKADG